MARKFLLTIVLFFAVTIGVDSQLDSLDPSIVDNGLTYLPDKQFIDTGVNNQISFQYQSKDISKPYFTVRSFPNGTRNCYTFRSLTVGYKYLVRGTFLYGNYDSLNNPPIFDIHLGVNYWDTVNASTAYYTEIIAGATADYLQVCLVNRGLGTPFISTLELKQLKTSMYIKLNSSEALVNVFRNNFGASNLDTIRYPDDRYDRWWLNEFYKTWTEVSTKASVGSSDSEFDTPSIVLQTAAITSSTNEPFMFVWPSDSPSTIFYFVLYIAEVQDIPSTALREFSIACNQITLLESLIPRPVSGRNTKTSWQGVLAGTTSYSLSLQATLSSTLPPLLNAIEVHRVTEFTGVPTDSRDVSAINAIKENYRVNKGWSGDPCVPVDYAWTGLNCTLYSNVPRITKLNLSSTELTGALISSFGNLTALVSLDLSENDLSGSLPAFLDQLVALTYLDITGNEKISTTLPPGLQKKQQDGTLTYKYKFVDSTQQSDKKKVPFDSTQQSKKKNITVVMIAAVIGVVVLLLLTVAIILIVRLRRRAYNQINIPKPNESSGSSPLTNNYAGNYAYSLEASSPPGNNAGQGYAHISQSNGPGQHMPAPGPIAT